MASMLELALAAAYRPLVGVERRRPLIAHAVALREAIRAGDPRSRRTTADAACGRKVAILSPFVWWAPKVRGLTVTRCPECEALHGRHVAKPPRWAVG